ncbi:TlpA family protein disulfide reductase [Myroides odoratimimus]|uniref:TlpA family protein disulfide reductase n=1 Tax=Myroides odoratimimus TaxID=76832 RepID=UPI0029C0CB2D|nr:TlpA disulfide reductase family protein [Myroides odoratimimus]MDX4974838.1 TlpA disulfide reductase family protein [Myroides odoratimimus]
MKKYFIIPFLGLLLACNQKEKANKDYVIIHGTISEQDETMKQLRLFDPSTNKSTLTDIDANGNFRDTLRLENPTSFNVTYSGALFNLFLENGMDLEINFEGNDVTKTLKYKGEGEEENNSLLKRVRTSNEFFRTEYENLISLEEGDFKAKLNGFIEKLNVDLIQNGKKYSQAFIDSEHKVFESLKEGIEYQYNREVQMKKTIDKGMQSPEFVDYINYKGGKTSLSDLKGKYVYIDVWATWCGPCMYEIPHMNKLEEKFKNSNIHFVSISIDRKQDEDKWRKMIVAKNMDAGMQLLADNEFESSFVKDYFIDGIPRFILLDPEGKIVTNDAPRPSEERTVTLLKSLGL